METPVKIAGSIMIEIPTTKWEEKKGVDNSALNIWATVANPRNEYKSLGIRCHAPSVKDPKYEIQNFYGDNSRLDQVTD